MKKPRGGLTRASYCCPHTRSGSLPNLRYCMGNAAKLTACAWLDAGRAEQERQQPAAAQAAQTAEPDAQSPTKAHSPSEAARERFAADMRRSSSATQLSAAAQLARAAGSQRGSGDALSQAAEAADEAEASAGEDTSLLPPQSPAASPSRSKCVMCH